MISWGWITRIRTEWEWLNHKEESLKNKDEERRILIENKIVNEENKSEYEVEVLDWLTTYKNQNEELQITIENNYSFIDLTNYSWIFSNNNRNNESNKHIKHEETNIIVDNKNNNKIQK